MFFWRKILVVFLRRGTLFPKQSHAKLAGEHRVLFVFARVVAHNEPPGIGKQDVLYSVSQKKGTDRVFSTTPSQKKGADNNRRLFSGTAHRYLFSGTVNRAHSTISCVCTPVSAVPEKRCR